MFQVFAHAVPSARNAFPQLSPWKSSTSPRQGFQTPATIMLCPPLYVSNNTSLRVMHETPMGSDFIGFLCYLIAFYTFENIILRRGPYLP